jgi:plasmid stabilization system protein ParE
MTTVLLVDEAERQLRDIVAWWAEHRSSAGDLVLQELESAIALLEASPDAGVRFQRTPVPGVRRLVMRRTRHHIYYVHDEQHELVYVLAIWGAPKHGDPVLGDPRR